MLTSKLVLFKHRYIIFKLKLQQKKLPHSSFGLKITNAPYLFHKKLSANIED